MHQSSREDVEALKDGIAKGYADMEDKMKKLELMHRYEREKIDLTIPAQPVKIGNLHPVTLVRNQLIDIFAGMGFEIYEGSEIETDYYNFTALNTPKGCHIFTEHLLYKHIQHSL